MNLRTWTLLPLLLFPALAACAEKKDLSPPPLNPHPKEALHVSVTFDHPEDAKRYLVTMNALYRNQQRECGYIDPSLGGNFIYPAGVFVVPNESSDPKQARFNVYLDRYHEDSCNWELAVPDITIYDIYTGRDVFGRWGLAEDLAPGAEYKAICLFQEDEYPQICYGRWPVPDVPHYSRVPITVRVSKESALLHPSLPRYYGPENFIEPVRPNVASNPPSPGSND